MAEAENGRAALEQLGRMERPDVVFVDCFMPEMDGFEFLRAVRADDRYADLPLLMASGDQGPAEQARALTEGADAYVTKPFSREAIEAKLQQLGVDRWEPDMSKIRVLVVDDAVVVRRMVADLLAEDDAIEVVATAPNGRVALAKIAQLNPDLVTLDLEMPEMDGLNTLAAVRRAHPRLPVLVVSRFARAGAAITLDALALGAADYVAMPEKGGEAPTASGVRARPVDSPRSSASGFARPAVATRPCRRRSRGRLPAPPCSFCDPKLRW